MTRRPPLLLLPLLDLVDGGPLGALGLLLPLPPIEDRVELLLIDLTASLGDLALERVDLLDVLSLFLVFFCLFVGLDRLVELLVFQLLPPLLKRLHLLLLLD